MEDELDKIAEGDLAWVDVIREFYGPFAVQMEKAAEEMPEVKPEPELLDRICPECGHQLMIRHGRFGKFIGCSNFPECRHTEPWLEKIGVTCPLDGGDLVERRTRRGQSVLRMRQLSGVRIHVVEASDWLRRALIVAACWLSKARTRQAVPSVSASSTSRPCEPAETDPA